MGSRLETGPIELPMGSIRACANRGLVPLGSSVLLDGSKKTRKL